MIGGRYLLTDLAALLLEHDWHESARNRVQLVEVEGSLEVFQSVSAEHHFAFLPVVQEVGRREETSDRLHPAGRAVDGIFGLGIALVSRSPLHKGQMTACRKAGYADALRIDLVILGVE